MFVSKEEPWIHDSIPASNRQLAEWTASIKPSKPNKKYRQVDGFRLCDARGNMFNYISPQGKNFETYLALLAQMKLKIG